MALFVAALLASSLLAGCSGVPTSSGPRVVRSIGFGDTRAPTVAAPAPGADPRSVVLGFLAANTTDPDRHNAARQYLTNETAQKWQDTTVTVVNGPPFVGTPDPVTHAVTVRFLRVGQLSAAGIYTPLLVGNGVGQEETSTFGLVQEKGQWRINQLPPGLLLTSSQFESVYNTRPLYFLNAAGTRLVPDLRWSALQGQSLASFLLAQLVAGPRPELANAVNSQIPAQASQQRVSVSVGIPSEVQLPGAGGLDPSSRIRLAAQLAYTLRVSGFVTSLTLRDGNDTVQVPGVPANFDAGSLPQFAPVSTSVPILTFVRGGAVYDDSGKPISGPLGTPRFGLSSAVFQRNSTRSAVAGTTGPANAATLLTGDTQNLVASAVPPGPLTRPAWAPGTDEVWVGSGATLYRVSSGKGTSVVAQTSGRGGPINGSIVALSFSPEGSRLALVINAADGTSQAWLGSVVRSGPDVRLDELEPITPPAIKVLDIGWRDDTTLLTVGQDPSRAGGQAGFWRVRVDGSELVSSDDLAGLPDAPRTLAVSPTSQVIWVSVGSGAASTVWERSSSALSWSAPTGGASELGSAPAFSQ